MKLLVTGAGSYIGSKVSEYILQKETDWTVYQLDVQSDDWKKFDFSCYDAVFHVAGLAHRKITPDIEPLYYKVNRDLALSIAKKAKSDGIRHFIFMSSMSVYSDDLTYVDKDSPTKPDNAYGKSKLQAEVVINELADQDFIVSIIRPPMIYGKGCKGNYNSLRSIALKYPFFPKVNNKRSMLYIDNLSEFIYVLVKNPQKGVFFPQNKELVNTTEWVQYIAEEHGKKVYASVVLGWFARLGKHFPGIKTYCIKAFGDSYYDPSMSSFGQDNYCVIDFKKSIKRTEA